MRSGWSSVNIAPQFPDKSICAQSGVAIKTAASVTLTKQNWFMKKRCPPRNDEKNNGAVTRPYYITLLKYPATY